MEFNVNGYLLKVFYKLKLVLEDKRITAKYGRISYYDNQGDSPTVIFLNDVSSNREWIKNQLDASNLRVIVPDFLGFGSSHRTDNQEAYTVEQYTHDILQIINHENLDHIILVGIGFGGLVALSLTQVVKVDALIEIMTPHLIDDIADNFASMSFKEYLGYFNKEIERYTRINTPVSKLIASHMRTMDPLSVWSFYVSVTDYLHSKISSLEVEVPHYYLVSEYFRGNTKTEKIMKRGSALVHYVPNSHQNVHIENSAYIWQLIDDIIDKLN